MLALILEKTIGICSSIASPVIGACQNVYNSFLSRPAREERKARRQAKKEKEEMKKALKQKKKERCARGEQQKQSPVVSNMIARYKQSGTSEGTPNFTFDASTKFQD